MTPAARYSQRGSLVLVVLCFVAVLGIGLASYVALCSRSMQLSNRSVQTGLSKQIAESALEEALRALNKNDWSGWSTGGVTVTWSDNGTAGKKATISFPSSKFGQGVTASAKIRIDNYNYAQLPANWATGINYRLNDTVNYSGSWYKCVRATSSQTPNGFANMAYWVPAPINSIWDSTITYSARSMVYYTTNNTWYRCILAPTANQAPTNGTYWTSIPRITLDNGYVGTNGEELMYFGTWYYYNAFSSPYWFAMPSSLTPNTEWCWQSGRNYSFNDLVYYSASEVWYRCISSHTSSGTITPANATYWENALTGSWAWNSAYSYKLNDVVYRSGSFYRCILAHSNQGPPNSTYWSTAPLVSSTWDSGRQYSQYDTAFYNGVWYLSLQGSNVGQNPTTASSYWIGANTSTSSYQWNATTAYNSGDYKCYGGVWYKCTTANTGYSPNNTSYWTASWSNGWGVTTGAPVIYAEGTVSSAGNPSVKTQLRTVVASAPLFSNAVGAASTLTINGGGTVDSYDSTLGTYNVSGNIGYAAVLAAAGTTNPTLTVTSTTVNGYIAALSNTSSPYAPMWTHGGSAVLRGTSTGAGVDLTRASRSPFVPQFDCLPSGGLTAAFSAGSFFKGTLISDPTAADTTLNLGTPGAATPSVYYYNSGLQVQSGSSSYYKTININGPIILYINGFLRANTGGTFVINNTGSAEIHFATNLQCYSGCGGFINRTKDPKKLTLLGDGSTSTACYLYPFTDPSSLDNSFYGTIYMPNTGAPGGVTIYTGVVIYGAISAKNVTFDAEATVHYDTSLRYTAISGVSQPFAITQWRELTDPIEQATMP